MNHWRLCCVFLLLQLPPLTVSSGSLVKHLPGYDGDLPFHLETGYIGVGEAEELQIFYLFMESQRNPSKDPLVLWLLGGPGCASLSSFFFENGPLIFDLDYDGGFPKLKLNPYSWTQVVNLLYIDVPVGTGFSYSETQEGYYSTNTIWVDQAYGFLQQFFIKYPQFHSNPLYVGGGSYDGMAVPLLVQQILEGNQPGSTPAMNLRGYVLGSPFTDLYSDNNMKIEYAYRMALLPDELYESMKANCKGDYINIDPNNTKCVSDYQTYNDLIRYINKDNIMEPDCLTTPDEKQRVLIQDSKTIRQPIQDSYDFWCRRLDYAQLNIWANDDKAREALHIRKGTKGVFERCNGSLAFEEVLYNVVDYHRNLTYTDLQSLIYCGDLDMDVPHISTQHWIKSLNMSVAYPWRPWFVEGQVAGYLEIYQRKDDYYMTLATVKGAGHVPDGYKPKQVLNLVERWISSSVI